MNFKDVVGFMEKLTGAVIRIDPQLQNQELTLDFQDSDFLDALDIIAQITGSSVKTDANKPNEFELVRNQPNNDTAPALPSAAQ